MKRFLIALSTLATAAAFAADGGATPDVVMKTADRLMYKD